MFLVKYTNENDEILFHEVLSKDFYIFFDKAENFLAFYDIVNNKSIDWNKNLIEYGNYSNDYINKLKTEAIKAGKLAEDDFIFLDAKPWEPRIDINFILNHFNIF